MHFGEPVDDERLVALLRPGDGIGTVITADAYGAGEADALLGRALAGCRATTTASSAPIGHDFYEGEREGAKGFPRFTDPRAARPGGRTPTTCGWRPSAASSAAASTRFDLLLLHNPDRTGLHERGGLGRHGGAARRRPDRAARRRARAGQRLHARRHRLLRALRRADRLGDGHPQPARAVARRAVPRRRRARTTSSVITRVVDYGGLFWDDVAPGHEFATRDHRTFRPDGWVEAGRERLERMRPIAERHGLTTLQLACQWNLAHEPSPASCRRSSRSPGRGARADRGQARRAGRRARRGRARRRRGRGDPRDRRQHRLHGAQGRRARPRGRAAPDRWPLDRGPRRGGRALGDRARARPAPAARASDLPAAAAGPLPFPTPGGAVVCAPPSAVRRESTSPPSGFVRVP